MELLQVEQLLTRMFNEVLPNQRSAALELGKQLPHRQKGGRTKAVPDEAAGQEINRKISAFIADGLSVGDAQKRVATQEQISERTIRRIWQRPRRFKNSEIGGPTTQNR